MAMENMKPKPMTLATLSLLPLILVIITHSLSVHALGPQSTINGLGIEAIYQFGDSVSDTGNSIRESNGAQFSWARYPYGIDFYGHLPTGRCSDGLLIIDYIAKFFKLPLLEPYLKKDRNFNHGVNFAVVGATALDASILAAKDISVITTSSLSVQLNWFRSHLTSICLTPTDCKKKLGKALFVIGEIGGNDLNYALLQGESVQNLQNMALEVVQAIKNAVDEVISLGATRVLVPGNFPMGCMPIALASFQTNDPTMYDELKCLRNLNEFTKFQNGHLQQAISELQRKHPHVTIVYGDLFNGVLRVLRYATSFGFDRNSIHKVCCGSGNNAYNFNINRMCGQGGSQVCRNPRSYVNWDGIHLTSHAYEEVANFILKDIVYQ